MRCALFVALASWCLGSSIASAASPTGGGGYEGTLRAGRTRARVVLEVSPARTRLTARLTCLTGGRAAAPIGGIRVRSGSFSGRQVRHRRVVWAISGRFTRATRAAATVRMPGACRRGPGRVQLALRPAPLRDRLYVGTLTAHHHRDRVTVLTSANAGSLRASIACLRGGPAAGQIAGVAVHAGRFAASRRRKGRAVWSISGRFTSARSIVAGVSLTRACDRGRGTVRLSLQSGPAASSGGPHPSGAPGPPAVGAPGPGSGPAPSSPPAPGSQGPFQEAYARQLVSAAERPDSLGSAQSAAATLLSDAGIGVPSDAGGHAAGDRGVPAGGLQLDDASLVRVAQDLQARPQGGRISLLDLAVFLDGTGVGMSDSGQGDGTTAPYVTAQKLEQLLARWLAYARANPDRPDAQPIFVLQALAQSQQEPPIDLATPGYDPEQLLLGNADVAVLISGIAQFAPVFRGGEAAPSATRAAVRGTRAMERAAPGESTTPCTDLKTTLDNAVPMAGGTWGYAVGQVGTAAFSGEAAEITQEIAEALGGDPGPDLANRFGNLMSALGLLAKAQSLVELYEDTTVSLEPADQTIDQPGQNDPDATGDVTAVAGVDDTIWDGFVAQAQSLVATQQLKDCASLLGLPTATSPADIASAIPNWRAEWRLDGTSDAEISTKYNDFNASGTLAKKLVPDSDHSGESTLTVDAVHENRDLRDDDVAVPEHGIVRVAVHTDPPPNIAAFLDGANSGAAIAENENPLGLAVDVGNVLLGMFQALDTFNASTKITVVHFEPANARWTGTITYDRGYAFQSHKADSGVIQPDGHYTSESDQDVRKHTVGSIDVDGQDSAPGEYAAPAWTLYGEARSGEHYTLDSTESHSSSGPGCSSSESDVGSEVEHAFGTGPANAGVKIQENGDWTVSGTLPDLTYDDTTTSHTENHSSCDGDSAPVDSSYHEIGTTQGPSFSVSGHIDPAHPPTKLVGTYQDSSDPTTKLVVTVALDYHAPVVPPPSP